MLNKRIRELRIARGMSQVQFASALGVTKQCVSNWENDNIRPSVEMLIRIADCLGVTTDDLLGHGGRTLNVDGLTEEQIGHLALLIRDLKQK